MNHSEKQNEQHYEERHDNYHEDQQHEDHHANQHTLHQKHQTNQTRTSYELVRMHPAETITFMPDVHFPPYITLAHTFHAPEGWRVEQRILKQYALQYVIHGVAEYPVAGNEYVTEAGDLLFHRPGELHSIRTLPGKPYVCVSLVFHFGLAAFPFDELLGNRHLLGRYPSGHAVERCLMALVHWHAQPGVAAKVKCQGLLLQLLGDAAAEEVKQDKKQAASLAKMILIKNYIIHHYPEQLQLRDLEKVSGLSQNYILQQFKQTFGMSPIQFLAAVRVQKAKELALQTELSVSEIARQVGYADVHTFGKMFKKKTGVSLTEFCGTLTTHYLNTKPRILDDKGEEAQ